MGEKQCVLTERVCMACGECDRCDVDSAKICDNCRRCLQGDQDYNMLPIAGIVLSEAEQFHESQQTAVRLTPIRATRKKRS